MSWVEIFGPPTPENKSIWVAYLVGVLTFIAVVFGPKKETKHAVQAKRNKKDRIEQGLRLLIEDTKMKDDASKDGVQREEGLPEASRVLSYVYDDVEAAPTTIFGVVGTSSDYQGALQLLDRTLQVQLRKTAKFTAQAKGMSNLLKSIEAGKAASSATEVGLPQSKSAEELEMEAWIEANKTTQKEVASYLSGEKLDKAIELGTRIQEKLDKTVLSESTRTMLSECKQLQKGMKKPGAAMETMWKILVSIAPFWILSVVFGIVGPFMHFTFDHVITGEIVNQSFREDGSWDQERCWELCKALVLTVACWMLSGVASCLTMSMAKQQFTMQLKTRFMECMVFQDFEYFEKHGTGVLQDRLNSDVAKVTESLLSLPKEMICIVIAMLTQLSRILFLAPMKIVLVALIPIPIIAFTNNRIQKFARRENEKGRKVSELAVSGTMDVLSNIQTVRTFAMERDEVIRFKHSGELQSSLSRKTEVVVMLAMHTCHFLLLSNVGCLSYLCASSVSAGTMKLNDVGVFLLQVGLHFTCRFQHFFDLVPQVLKMLDPLYRVVEHLNAESKIEPNPNIKGCGPIRLTVGSKEELTSTLSKLETVNTDGSSFIQARVSLNADDDETVEKTLRMISYTTQDGEEKYAYSTSDLSQSMAAPGMHWPICLIFARKFIPTKFEGSISFQDVHFYYPLDLRKKVLNGLTFEVKRGEKVGLCGEAGCGKSTTFLLLQRLFDADANSGHLLIDGKDIRQYDVHFLRQHISMVAQKSVLFKTTVKDNILYGVRRWQGRTDEEAKREQTEAVTEALKKAQAWDFIDAKPDKLLTVLTETGGGFSGGQMQRLAIARVLIRKPNVILLDEATAALDPVNERAVQDTLDQVMKGYTTLAIAHRLTTIKDSTKIVVLDQGRVVEMGSHDELLAIPIEHETVEAGGKVKIKSGFYRHQWDTQFKEKGLTTDKLRTKIEQMQHEIDVHKAKLHATRSNMSKWRAVGTVLQRFGSADLAQGNAQDAEEYMDSEDVSELARDSTAVEGQRASLERFVTALA